MKTEKLIAKGVEKKFDGQQLWFSVESLNEHYKGVKYHESDLDESGFIKASDIFGDDIQEIEVDETLEENIEVDAVEPITEVAKTILESRILKADYVEQTELKAEQIIQGIAPDGVSIDLETIEEIIPAKVVKTKNDKK